MNLDYSPLISTIAANTEAVTRLANILEKAAGATPAGEAQTKRGPGRPAKTVETPAATVASTAQTAPVSTQTVVAPASANPAATAASGSLTHLALKQLFLDFAKSKGRDAVVALLGEFGAVEFAKVKAEDLPLFKDRLEGKPQTPVASSDMANLLGM